MNLPKLIKDNLVLSLGLAAPVLLMGFFFIMASLNRTATLSAADIHYDILLSDESGYNNRTSINALVFVENNTLYTQYSRAQQGWGMLPRLYIYEAASGKIRQLDFPPPDVKDESILGKKIVVETTKSMKIDTALTSPDGYEFTYGSDDYNHGGIINEMFIGGSYNNNYGPRLKKGTASFRLPMNNGVYGYSQLRFIGWVTSKQG